MKKRFLGLILVFILAMAMNISVYAADDSIPDMPMAGTYEYYSYFYNGASNALITDRNGNDFTDFFVSNTKEYFANHDLKSIKKFKADNGLVSHLFYEVISPIQPFAYEQYKTVYDTLEDNYTDTKYGTSMDFACKLSGGMWYNPNIYQITRVAKPTFTTLYAMPPSGITPSVNEITTGSNIVNGKAYFWAHFQITGEGFIDGHYFDCYDYGSHTISFYAKP